MVRDTLFLLSAMLNAHVDSETFEDNSAVCAVVAVGFSTCLRFVARQHRISVGVLSEIYAVDGGSFTCIFKAVETLMVCPKQ